MKLDRIAALDGLRGIAVVMVLVFHAGAQSQVQQFGPWSYYASSVIAGGWLGVDLFFVLSGFLITRILLNTSGSSNYFQSFYARRFLRIFPLYWGFLALSFWVLPGTSDSPWLRENQLWYWSYLSNWLMYSAEVQSPELNHFWSLAIEEQFYLFWPLLLFFLPIKRAKIACWVLLSACLVARAYFVLLEPKDPRLSFSTFLRLDGLMMGALVAFYVQPGRAVRIAVKTALVISLGALAYLQYSEGRILLGSLNVSLFGLAAANICFACLVFLCVHRDRRISQLFDQTILKVLGKYSYCIYVVHIAVIQFLKPVFFETFGPWVRGGPDFLLFRVVFILCVIALSFVIAVLSWHFFERPILNLRRFFPSAEESGIEGGNLVDPEKAVAEKRSPA